MKSILVIIFLITGTSTFAQSKEEAQVLNPASYFYGELAPKE